MTKRLNLDSSIYLNLSLTLFLFFNPFILLLSASGFRQGIGAIFVLSLKAILSNRWSAFFILGILSILSHNSFLYLLLQSLL